MMVTLREFIVNQSSLPSGNTIRDHIKNPDEVGSGLVLSDGLEVEVSENKYDIEVDVKEFIIEIDDGFLVEIENEEYDLEVN